jgi:peptidoglycan hydrolase-like protein with peptidoglycan-binding domain
MKKAISIAAVGSILAFALVASAAGYTFSNYLSVGSTGADVTALQTWLVANNFSIPSISSGVAAKGYFGSQTKAAVVAYQASVGLPNTGFVGPLTIAKLNAGATASTGGAMAMSCPVGFTCTPVAGAVVSPVSTSAGTAISTPGIPGTLVPNIWTSPSNGTVVYKGQSYDVSSYKVQSSASDMAVQSIALDFDTRLWLYATSITIHDQTGAVVGQVNNLSAANFTELTVGSDYRITIPVSNYVVKAAQTQYLTVNVTFLATSDRATGLIGVTNFQIRSVDGTGVTDTENVSSNVTTEVGGASTVPLCAAASNCRYFSYQGSGAGSVVVTTDSSSPLSGLVQISTGGQTQNVPLAVYDVKVQNAPANLRALSFVVYTTGGKTPEQLFSQYSLKIAGQTFGANSITPNTSSSNAQGASSTITFTNFGAIALAADTYVPVTLVANVQQDTNNNLDGIMASTTLVVGGTNPDVEDQSFTVLAVNAGTFISSNLTFSGSSATLSNLTASIGSAIVKNNTTTGYSVSFGFSLTAGNNTLYVSADPSQALSTSTCSATCTLPLSGVITNPGNLSGDTSVTTRNGYYIIPAGSSRSFVFNGSIDNTNGASGLQSFAITAVKYGTTTTALQGGIINYNLQSLKVNPVF